MVLRNEGMKDENGPFHKQKKNVMKILIKKKRKGRRPTMTRTVTTTTRGKKNQIRFPSLLPYIIIEGLERHNI